MQYPPYRCPPGVRCRCDGCVPCHSLCQQQQSGLAAVAEHCQHGARSCSINSSEFCFRHGFVDFGVASPDEGQLELMLQAALDLMQKSLASALRHFQDAAAAFTCCQQDALDAALRNAELAMDQGIHRTDMAVRVVSFIQHKEQQQQQWRWQQERQRGLQWGFGQQHSAAAASVTRTAPSNALCVLQSYQQAIELQELYKQYEQYEQYKQCSEQQQRLLLLLADLLPPQDAVDEEGEEEQEVTSGYVPLAARQDAAN